MRNRILMLCGILAPIVYAVAVVLGGIVRPGYSHISQFISELIAAGAPNKSLLDPPFALYNLLTIPWNCSAGRSVPERPAGRLAGQAFRTNTRTNRVSPLVR
jgi:hypothetical protein